MKYLFALMAVLCLALSITLPGYAGSGRPSFSSQPSYSGGFRSSTSPSYRSFSPSPSRSFTYKASPPSYSAPAATRQTYKYSAPVTARPISRSTTKNTTVNHYHTGGSSSGGGLSLMDYVMLNSLTNHDHGPTYVNPQPVAASATMGSYEAPAVIYQQEESHFWRNSFLFVLAVVIIAGLAAALVHYLDLGADYDD